MLTVPQLDDSSYEKLFERARSQIPALAPRWTDLNHHDPGITTLQVLSWLTDMLNYYIDATGEAHRLKYLKLLGIVPQSAPARCRVVLSAPREELSLPRGTRMAAGEVNFELEEGCRQRINRLTALVSRVGETYAELSGLAGLDGGCVPVFTLSPEEDAELYFGFAQALSDSFRFYVEAETHPDRNPFGDGFSLATLEWEFFGEQGWQRVSSVEDGTCGFLRGGYVDVVLPASTVQTGNAVLPEAHYLRARLVDNQYDARPRVGRIWPNCVELVQRQTFAQTLRLTADGGDSYALDCYFREEDLISVAVETAEGYSLWLAPGMKAEPLCRLEPGEQPWLRRLVFDRERPPAGTGILVFAADGNRWEEFCLGRTTGRAGQRLHFDAQNLLELELALAEVRDGRPLLRIWEHCAELGAAGSGDAVFAWDPERSEVVFGDAIHGLQPPPGLEVYAVCVRTSRLGEGNVLRGQVNRFPDPVPDGISGRNPENASGGISPKVSGELEQEIGAKLARVGRAVSAEDYAALAKATPGLRIDGVGVVSGREYAARYGEYVPPNTVYLAVKPRSERSPRPVLSEVYRSKLRKHLEAYRLLMTNPVVVSPRYVPVTVHGRIRLRENTPAARAEVEAALRELVDLAPRSLFGRDVVYGRVYARLETLECVRQTEQLSLECVGTGGERNAQGDVLIHPDALACLEGIDLEYI